MTYASTGSCVSGSSVTIGRGTNPGGTTEPVNGTGTYSAIAGCSADGGDSRGGTVYGAFGKASGEGAAAFGFLASAAKWGTALGLESVAAGIASTAAGFGSNATGLNSVAIGGSAANATGTSALTVANSTTASAEGAIAIGSNTTRGAQAKADNSIALGAQSTAEASATSSVAIGKLASVATANSVALGSNASATGSTLGTLAYGVGGSAAAGGEVNIANGANGRRITGLAAGANATDAVNVSQLNKAGQDTATALGGGATLNATTGAWTAPSYSTNTISATGANTGALVSSNVGAALSNLNTSLTNTAAVAVKYDDASTKSQVTFNPAGTAVKLTNVAPGVLNATSTDTVNGSQLFANSQNTAAALGGGAAVNTTTGAWTAPSYSTNSINVTGANTGPLVSSTVGAALGDLNTSLTNTAAVAVKYDDASSKTQVTFNPAGTAVKLTNVAAGALNSTSTDAVNGSQLFATNQTVDNIVKNGAGIKYFHSNSVLADSSATGQDSVAMGPAALSAGASSVALGNGAMASVDNSIALGSGSSATGTTLANAAYGVGGAATGGEVNIANGANGRRITGLTAGSAATDAVNVSQLNQVGQSAALALGGGALLDANTGVWTAPSYATNSISVTGANAGTQVSSNVGAALANLDTSVTNTAAVAVKYDDATTKTQVTFNPTGTAVKLTNVAAGTLNATSTDAVNGSQLFATNTTVDGLSTQVDDLVNNGAGIKYFHANSTLADSSATGLDSVAIGPQSVAAGASSLAVGSGANAAAQGSLALGRSTLAQVAGGVALGEGSIADRALAPATGTIAAGSGAIVYDTSDATLLGSVSVGKAGNYRQITNVADGTEAHDAVTLRQLIGAMGSLSVSGTQYFHANSTNLVDSLASGAESIAVGPATVVNGDNGIGMGNQASVGQAAAGGIAIGRNAQVLMASGIAMGSTAQAGAEQSVALGAGANASQAMSVALGSSSVTTVGAETGYSAYRLAAAQTSVGEIGIGTATGSRKLTGLAAGTQDNDAVNVAQLKQVGDQVDQNTTAISNLDGRVGGLETLIGSGGGIKYLHVNSIKADSAATGTDAMALGAQAQASGNGAVAVGNGATTSADGSVALGSGSSDGGRGAETYSGVYSGASNVTSGTVSVGNAANGETRTVSNVADGRNANDAVNVRQLDGAVAQANKYTDDSIANLSVSAGQQDGRITTVANDVASLQNGTDGMFQVNNTGGPAKPKAAGVDAVAGGAQAVASGKNSAALGTRSQALAENAVAVGNGAKASARNATALGTNAVADRENSVSVGSVGDERQITNVAAGTRGTDAVNLDQLSASVADITSGANAYTDQRYMELKNDLKQQDEILSAGIAGAMAMASLPQSYSPGSSMTVAAVSSYRGQASLAFGVSHMSSNGRWVTKLQGSTDTQRKVGVALGVGYQW